jgi:glycosyltransferase involved in cell wall biosynthesis
VKFLNRWPEGRVQLDRLKARYRADNIDLIDEHCSDIGNLIARGCGVVIPYRNLSQGDLPLSAIESWSVGRPIVATALPGIATLLEECDAGKISELSPHALAAAMRTVADDAHKMRESCLILARQFDSSVFIDRYGRLLLGNQNP